MELTQSNEIIGHSTVSIRQTPEIGKLGAALAKAQGAIEGADKNSANEAFRQGSKVSKYSNLSAVWDACRKPLADNGLAVIQLPHTYNGQTVTLTTRLVHESGEWIESSLACHVGKPNAHGVGSVITYLRRYMLASLVGIYQEDDDGNEASIVGQRGEKHNAPVEKVALLTPEEQAKIVDLAEKSGSELPKIAQFYGKTEIKEIERIHFQACVNMLEKKLAKASAKADKQATTEGEQE